MSSRWHQQQKKGSKDTMNSFFFEITEETLKQALAEIQRRKEARPQTGFLLEISVDLTPDGVGYEATRPRATIVEQKPRYAPA